MSLYENCLGNLVFVVITCFVFLADPSFGGASKCQHLHDVLFVMCVFCYLVNMGY
jgi:hypothetical protein